jgi:hypothetical protein
MFPGVSIYSRDTDYRDEFALLYDWTASQIDPKIGRIPFRDFNAWFNIVLDADGNLNSGKPDKYIYSEGEQLQQYVYFADDYFAEERQLKAEVRGLVEWSGWAKVPSAKGVTTEPIGQFGNSNNNNSNNISGISTIHGVQKNQMSKADLDRINVWRHKDPGNSNEFFNSSNLLVEARGNNTSVTNPFRSSVFGHDNTGRPVINAQAMGQFGNNKNNSISQSRQPVYSMGQFGNSNYSDSDDDTPIVELMKRPDIKEQLNSIREEKERSYGSSVLPVEATVTDYQKIPFGLMSASDQHSNSKQQVVFKKENPSGNLLDHFSEVFVQPRYNLLANQNDMKVEEQRATSYGNSGQVDLSQSMKHVFAKKPDVYVKPRSEFQSPPYTPPRHTVTPATANFDNEEAKQPGFLGSWFGWKGGKRRTMKAKKYLKNNRKKTIRKSNKKTIRKNKKNNHKKTRKSKY